MRWLSVLLLLASAACVSVYEPFAPVVPLLDERGDVSISARMRARGPLLGAGAAITAAPTESTRVFAGGSFSHDAGARRTDEFGARHKERTQDGRIEAGGGWGFARGHFIAEALGGLAYGRTRSLHCNMYDWQDYADECPVWIGQRSRYVSAYGQLEMAGNFRYWTGGGGMRVAMAHYDFDRLFGQSTSKTAWLPTLEPFIVQRVGLPWGKLELGVQLPFVLQSATVSRTQTVDGRPDTQRDRLFLQPSPRVTLGLVFNIDELWRKR
jgi:hypothetical protein